MKSLSSIPVHSALSSQEVRLRNIIDHTPVGICITDEKGYFQAVNPAYCRIYDYRAEELVGQHFTMVVPPESRELLCDLHERFMHYGSEIRGEWTVVNKSGKRITVLADAAIIHDTEGQPQKATFVTDITDRKQIEQALEQSNRVKSEFLSNMSHELRSPLNAILGYSQLIKTVLEDPSEMMSREEHIRLNDHIINAGWHLLSLINDVLDLARIESGKIPVELKEIQLAHIFKEVHSILEAQPNAAKIHLKVIPPAADLYLYADATRLKQVLVNLGSNAIKYNRHGGTVTIRCEQRDNAIVRIFVEDTGIGIDPSQMDNLFRPFERLGAERTTIQGTGIGLTISQKLIQSMNGTIGVNSRLGQGTCFFIDLPEANPPAVAVVDSPAQTSTDKFRLFREQTKTVLYIEDTLSDRELMRKILARYHNIRLITAEDGLTGIEKACRKKPDLILSDLRLPDMHGCDVLSQLRNFDETKDIPVVAITSDLSSKEVQELEEFGFYTYIAKPFVMAQLLQTLAEVLFKTE
ncbi:ATP-binding protein [Heliophilum fasciatum]|uniref:ATP-binding protein n=1 Tax=Heliophilum fasciatum TaxID=35700 RepID=UPI001404B167|nr:ATP-binding protein [Heliophilum fasciatum]MCW2278380.1 PAS domain S-box-containing protein [Heliophilum fasciatum]